MPTKEAIDVMRRLHLDSYICGSFCTHQMYSCKIEDPQCVKKVTVVC